MIDPRKAILFVMVILPMLAGLMFVAFAMGPGEEGTDDPVGPTPEPEPEPEVPSVPEGFIFDPEENTLTYSGGSQWHVFDVYHTYYTDRYEVYGGYDVPGGSTVVLDPSRYRISAEGVQFDLDVPGDVTRECSWTFDKDGVKHSMHLDYTISEDMFSDATDANREVNSVTGNKLLFEDLPRIVVVDSVVEDIQSKLAAEYVRIGGSVSDRQGYSDFIASFVELTIGYPPSIDGGDYDKFVWGMEEYWCVPLETLWYGIGDCEDTSALMCAISKAAGYPVAMGGHSGHVFAGIHIDGFKEVSQERLDELGAGNYKVCYREGIVSGGAVNEPVYGPEGYYYYAVETTHDQIPVGYLMGGNSHLDKASWSNGWCGFYPVSG